MDLLARIDSWARVAPERIAHLGSGQTLTYAELSARAEALATHLARQLPDDHSPVAVLGHKEPEMLIAFLGAVKSGHPYIPLDTSLPVSRVERIVSSSGAQLTLTPERIAELSNVTADATPRRVRWDDPYYIIFTSGSTGEPKGVVITLEALTSFVEWMLGEQTLLERGEVFLNQAPFSFDLSVMDLYLSLASGGTLFSITADQIANPKQLYEAFAASNVTSWVSTPSFAQMCLVEKTFNARMLPRVRRFLFCGETLAPEVAAQLLERFPGAQVWNTYGPTEATCCTTSINVTRAVVEQYSPLPVGYAKPGTRILILGEEEREAERGEIVIAGPNVSTGYLGRPDLNERAFFRLGGLRAYRTGDLGHFEGGMLFFEGRLDSQIKLHGYRIELGDVESNLRALPGIRDAVVIPVLKGGRPDSLAAFVILTGPQTVSDFQLTLDLKKQLGARLPAYMLPRKFYCLDRFPMTPNGKADRRKLAESIL
jgi:D-alanine--poly(phosphoribitol) ligase subunit 1